MPPFLAVYQPVVKIRQMRNKEKQTILISENLYSIYITNTHVHTHMHMYLKAKGLKKRFLKIGFQRKISKN